jgi:hypothetical protein
MEDIRSQSARETVNKAYMPLKAESLHGEGSNDPFGAVESRVTKKSFLPIPMAILGDL